MFKLFSISLCLIIVTLVNYSTASVCNVENAGKRIALPKSCTKYLSCSSNRYVVIKECPKGLHFNRELEMCDFPSRAGCKYQELMSLASMCASCDCAACCSPVMPTPPVTVTPSTRTTCTSSPSKSTTSPQTVEPTTPVKLPSTPSDSSPNTEYTPIPTIDGTVTPTTPCGGSTHTNNTPIPTVSSTVTSTLPNTEVTVTPSIPTSGTPNTQGTPLPTTDGTVTPTIPTSSTPNTQCTTLPTTDGTVTPVIPAPSTPTECEGVCCDKNNGIKISGNICQQFIVCQNEKPITFDCPNNLHYNAATGSCDFPENAKCNKPYQPPTGPHAGPSGTHCAVNGRCLGKSDGTSFPNANNQCSSSYVICQCECEVERSCSGPLMFNSKLGVCDWPISFGC